MAVEAVPTSGQDTDSVWSFDSMRPTQRQASRFATQQDQEVDAVINQMVLLWNNHDLDHYLQLFWNSDGLVVVQNGVPEFGWNRLRERYLISYADI